MTVEMADYTRPTPAQTLPVQIGTPGQHLAVNGSGTAPVWVDTQTVPRPDDTDTGAVLFVASGAKDRLEWRQPPFASTAEMQALAAQLAHLAIGYSHGISVEEITNTPPTNPYNGEAVIVGPAPTGAFVGHEHAVALWDGAAWQFTPPAADEMHLVWRPVPEIVKYDPVGRLWVHIALAPAVTPPNPTSHTNIRPGDALPSDPNFPTGYTSASGATAWVNGEAMTVGGASYWWDGAAWQTGTAPTASLTIPTRPAQTPPAAPAPMAVRMDGGELHGLALKPDGSIVQWGDTGSAQAVGKPTDAGIAVAAGSNHSLALKPDGSIVQWGSNRSSQAVGKPTDAGYVAIACGWHHGLALKPDGSIVQWGDTQFGQAVGKPTDAGYVAIAGGGLHSLALKPDGSIVQWGNTGFGQADNKPTDAGYIAIAGGDAHSFALKPDGSIVQWGRTSQHETDNKPTGPGIVPTDPNWP